MGMGLAILGGALQGLGSGIAQMGASEYQQRQQAALAALTAKYRTDELTTTEALNEKQAANQAQLDVGKYGAEKDADVAAETRILPAKTAARVTEISAETSGKMTEEQLQQQNRIALENLQHGHRMSEDQMKAAEDLQKSLTMARVEADRYEITSTGQIAAYAKDGHLIGISPRRGVFNPPNTNSLTGQSTPLGPPVAGDPGAAAPDGGMPSVSPQGPRAGQTASDGNGHQMYWNGTVWVPLTPGNQAEQQRLLSGGQ